MKRFVPMLATALLAGCTAVLEPDPDGEATFDAELGVALSTTLRAQHAEFAPPGIVAAVLMPDGAQWIGAVGDVDLDGTPLVGDEPFKIASVSKSFVAGLVMTLVDDGSLSLDDTIEEWIAHPRAAEITVRQLLDQSAGVPDFTRTADFQNAGVADWTDEELVDLVDDMPLAVEPGSAHAYSNTHYVMLGMIVEQTAEAPWQEELGRRVLEPLGLGGTRAPDGTEGWGDVVPGFLGDTDLTESIRPSAIGAAGNLVSTAEDLARWARGLWGGELLSEASTDALAADPLPIGGRFEYGLGTLVVDGVQRAHNGALNGYVSWSGYHPGHDVGLAVLANAWLEGNPPGVGYSTDIADALWADVLDAVE